jgi:hypothetical protein
MSIDIKQYKVHTVYIHNNNTGNIQDKANKYFHRGLTKVLLQIVHHDGIDTFRAHCSVNLAISVQVDDLHIVDLEYLPLTYPVIVKVVVLYALRLLVLHSKNSVIS